MDRAIWHERYLYWHNRPLTTGLLHVVARAGKSVYIPGLGYFVNDPELARGILTHPAFASTGVGSMDALVTHLVGPTALFNMDDPAHHELRSRLREVFALRNIEARTTAGTRAIAGRLRADLEAGRRVDLLPSVRQLTSGATCALLGITTAPADRERVYEEMAWLAGRMTRFLGLDKLEPSAATLAQARVFYDRLVALAAGSYAAATGEAPTVIDRMKAAGVSFDDAKGLIGTVLMAGIETATAAIPRMIALLLDSGQFARLATNRDLLPGAIVEAMRVICPSPAIVRAIHSDVEIAGTRFKQGRRMFILLYNVLKRHEHFPAPRRLDPERAIDPRYRHLPFGGGAHFCIGFPLAQRESSIVLEELLAVPGGLRIVGRGYPREMSFPAYTRLVLERAG